MGLIKLPADPVPPSSRADKLLLEAAKNRDLQGVKNALAAGADINARRVERIERKSGPGETDERWSREDLDLMDETGRTALMYAAEYGYIEIAEFLIDKGADINAKTRYSYTCLMYAERNGYSDIVELLKKRGALG